MSDAAATYPVESPAERERSAVPIVDEPSFSYLRHQIVSGLAFATVDAAALGLALWIAGLVRLWLVGDWFAPVYGWALLPLWWAGTAAMHLMTNWGLGPVEELRRVTILLAAVFAASATLLFLSGQVHAVSRISMVIAFFVSLVTVPMGRMYVKRLLITLDLWQIPTAVYGAGDTGRHIAEVLRQEKGLGFDPIVFFDDAFDKWGEQVGEVCVLGSTEVVMPHAPVAILAIPSADGKRLIELIEGPLAHYRRVLIIPDLLGAPSLWVRPRDLSGVLGLEIKNVLLSPYARLGKRVLDVAIVIAAAPLWIPACTVIMLLIWLNDGGSPFFTQERVGMRPFRVWKFRTMVENAEEVLQQTLEDDEALRREWDLHRKLRDDPRITRVGRMLRRLSLDELPQLMNVLRGEMSLVGPRPLPRYHYEQLAPRVRDLRERVRPGLTGLWQISGRSVTGTAGMEQWDAYYVRNWSPWLDIVILVRTWRAVLQGNGAY